MAGVAKVAQLLALIAVGGVFTLAGIPKAMDPAAFAVSIDYYRMLPWSGTAALALYLPWLEIFCAAALLTRKLRMGSLLVLLGLMVIFLCALISAAARGLDISCGCFGAGFDVRSLTGAIVQDLALLAAILFLLWCEVPRMTPD